MEPGRETIRPADVQGWRNLTAPARVGGEGLEDRAESVDHASRFLSLARAGGRAVAAARMRRPIPPCLLGHATRPTVGIVTELGPF